MSAATRYCCYQDLRELVKLSDELLCEETVNVIVDELRDVLCEAIDLYEKRKAR